MMTEKEFRGLCKNSGYAKATTVDSYIKKHKKQCYSDADIREVYRLDIKRENPLRNHRRHQLNGKTTKTCRWAGGSQVND